MSDEFIYLVITESPDSDESFGVTKRTARDTLETMHRMSLLENSGELGKRVTYLSKIDHPRQNL